MGSIFSTSSTPAAGTNQGSERLHGDAASKESGSAEPASMDEGDADSNSNEAMQSLRGNENASAAGPGDTASPRANLETATMLLGPPHINEALYEALSDDDAVDDTTGMDHSKSCLGKREAPSFQRNTPAKRQRMVYSPSLSLPAPVDTCSSLPFLQLDAAWSDLTPNENVHALFALTSPKATAEAADCPFA